jgi:hypothetical protein
MTTTLNWAASGLLLAGVALYTFWPKRVFAVRREKIRKDYLLECKDQVYENLRDLTFEYRSGKYSESEFEAQRAQLEVQAEHLLVEILDLHDGEIDLDG